MPTFHPRSLLITGGAGFIGSHFIRYLLNTLDNIHIINLDKLTYAGTLENLADISQHESYHFVQGDICDAALVSHLLQHHHIDTIVHFAAESHVDRSIQTPLAFVNTNIVGTFTLLEAARHHWFEVEGRNPLECRFHHISTDEVYGSLQPDSAKFTETTPYQPRSPYSASKASSDHLVHAYYHTYGLPITLSNCSNNYGSHQHPEKFIPTIIRACLAQKVIPIYGNGKNIRDWLYVEDHCRGILTILNHGKIGESYNLGGNNEWENIAVAHLICEQMDQLFPYQNPYRSLIQQVTDRPGHDFRYAIDSNKIQKDLGWTPLEEFSSGIKKTIKFYQKSFVTT